MSVSNAFNRLATIIAEIEADGVEVRDATIPTKQAAVADGKVHVTLDLSVALNDERELDERSFEPTTAGLTEATSDETTADQSGDSESPTDGSSTGQDSTERTASDDPAVVCPEPGCDETFESEPGMKIHRTKIHLRDQADEETAETPAYRDPETLRDAYQAHDSFPAMREALDVEVSAQTIRRHMIQHGIHDPTAGETESEDSGQSAASSATADGEALETVPLAETLPSEITVPEDITLAALKEAVRTADTLYEIQQQFDLDREETRQLLGELDLLELVHGRVATKHEREELKAEIDSRIRHSINGNETSA